MKKFLLYLAGLLVAVNLSAQCEDNTVIVTVETGAWAQEMIMVISAGDDDAVFDLGLSFPEIANNSVYSTEICLPDGCYEVYLGDTFGDGWNGGTVTVSYGEEMIQYSLEQGSLELTVLPINSEDCILEVEGCTDPEAINYMPWANVDDGSCEYPFSCDEGVQAQVYICTFGNGENVALEIVDSNGDVVFLHDELASGQIVYFDVCLDPEECYTVNMYNEADENGWYGGYFWILVEGEEIVQDELDYDLSMETITFSLNDTCPQLGCTDPEAVNYNDYATEDDGSCVYCDGDGVVFTLNTGAWGSEVSWNLIDSEGNVVAESDQDYDDYSTYESIICLNDGCYLFEMQDSFGDGWNGGFATIESNGEVIFEATLQTGDAGVQVLELNVEGCEDFPVGCADPEAMNYDPEATIDDGSCEYPIYGCTDPDAENYNPWANTDDGSCTYPVECAEGEVLATLYVCTFSNGEEVTLEIEDSEGNDIFLVNDLNSGQIVYFDLCLDPNECYSVNMSNSGGNTGWSGGYYWIVVDGVEVSSDELDDNLNYENVIFSIDGGCPVPGCTDPEALNYDPEANEDDGSCEYPEPCEENSIVLTIETASWGEEISWNLEDSEGNVVAEGGDYVTNSTYTIPVCLADGCYTMVLMDSFGDGWNGGSYSFELNGEIIAEGTLEQGNMQMDVLAVNSECGEIEIEGCTDPEALNYDPLATTDDGSCEYAVFGCTDPEALNYDSEATIDDGSCEYIVSGCTDPEALNYDPEANEDDGSCIYPEPCEENSLVLTIETAVWGEEIGWSILDSDNNVLAEGGGYASYSTNTIPVCLADGCYTMLLMDSFGDGWNGGSYSFELNGEIIAEGTLEQGDMQADVLSVNSDCEAIEVEGCTDPEAINYNPEATMDDGSCEYAILGCTDPAALNYNPEATIDDGSCEYEPVDVEGCTDPLATNYNPEATIDDGSCVYPEPCEANSVIVLMATEIWGEEISWNIVDAEGNVVAEGGDYSSNSLFTSEICLEDGCYTLNQFDSFGDGWNGAFISLLSGEDLIVLSTLEEGSEGQVGFGINADCEGDPIDVVGCTDPEALNYNPEATLDDGSCEYPGVYEGPMYMLTGQETVEPVFILSPNPGITHANLKMTELNAEENVTVEIHDLSGRLLFRQDYGSDISTLNIQLDIQDFATGIHIVQIFNGDQVHVERLIKQ